MSFFKNLFQKKIRDDTTKKSKIKGANMNINPTPETSIARKKGRLRRIQLMVNALPKDCERVEFFKAKERLLVAEIKLSEGDY